MFPKKDLVIFQCRTLLFRIIQDIKGLFKII